MEPLKSSLASFRQAITDGYSIRFDEEGNWCTRWSINQLIRRIFGWEQGDDKEMAAFFTKYLKTFEVVTKKVRPGFAGSDINELELEQTVAAIKERLKSYTDKEKAAIAAAKEQKQAIKQERVEHPGENVEARFQTAKQSLRNCRQEAVTQQAFLQIERQMLAIKYQSKSQHAIHTTKRGNKGKVQKENITWLTSKLIKWKKEQYPTLPSSLTEREKNMIKRITGYENVIPHLRENRLYREELFKFAFKTPQPTFEEAIDLFVQFPTIQQRITKGFLDKRNRRVPNLELQFTETITNKKPTKDVTIQIASSPVSLKNPHLNVKIRENDIRTVDQILTVFKNKNLERGDLEVTNDGITYYKPEDPLPHLNEEDFYKDLPSFDPLVSRKTLRKRYPNCDLKDAYALLVVKASRSSPDKEGKPRVDSNHSWFEIAAPMGNNQFKLLHPGKYAEIYTGETNWEQLIYAFNTHKGILTWLDENEFYFHREQVAFPIPIKTKERFDKLLEILKRKCQDAQAGNWVFEAQGDNCAPFIQEVVDELFPEVTLPRLYETDVLEIDLPFPLSLVTSVIRGAPTRTIGNIIHTAVTAFFVLLGGWKSIEVKQNNERVCKWLMNDPRWLEGKVAIPAMLFKTGQALQEAVANLS